MKAWESIIAVPAPRDRLFFATLAGEVYVARYYSEYPGPEILMWRQHRTRVDRQYRYFDAELDGEIVRASTPVNKPWKSEFESIWQSEMNGVRFEPTHWAPYLEPPK